MESEKKKGGGTQEEGKVFAEYASFRVEPEADFYKLRVGRYHGNAGDSLTWHNGKQFTTLDRDHDTYTGNCAHYQKGGWWYNSCAHSNLNGVWYRGGHYRSRYQDGVYWAEFRGGAYSLKKVLSMSEDNDRTFSGIKRDCALDDRHEQHNTTFTCETHTK
ncbi:Angiopoietin-related protein 2 [Liparis tanakae]|uniref:Angiopoietin-related protein 2 n=1 Tax=Liparis tanakae TaxID=230148 RepID=A0A4Z2J932_9TELE|nr:Angiopoietin-related protein 2 [Liparis tanakae]